MRKIFWIVFCCILSFVILSFVYFSNFYTEAPFPYKRQNISFLKFVSSENCIYSLDSSEINELKSLNVNGIRICPLFGVYGNGNLKVYNSENLVINLIRKAHKNGFAVFLDLNAGGVPKEDGTPEFQYNNEKYIDILYNISLHWCKIAENEKVEFFSPLNEPNLMFTNDALFNIWLNKSQELRKFFSGKLVLKLADLGPENISSIGAYDYLSFDIMWGTPTYDELKEHLRRAIEKANNLKEKYKLEGFFFGELGVPRFMTDKSTQAKIFEIFLNETWGEVEGYCFLGWSNLEFRFRDNEEAKEIIGKWYGKLNVP